MDLNISPCFHVKFAQSVGYRYQHWDASAGRRHNVIKTLNKNIHSQCHKCCSWPDEFYFTQDQVGGEMFAAGWKYRVSGSIETLTRSCSLIGPDPQHWPLIGCWPDSPTHNEVSPASCQTVNPRVINNQLNQSNSHHFCQNWWIQVSLYFYLSYISFNATELFANYFSRRKYFNIDISKILKIYIVILYSVCIPTIEQGGKH